MVLKGVIDAAFQIKKKKKPKLYKYAYLDITQKYDGGIEQNINPFTMVLKGVIDAAVNGGVKRYQEAFFAPEYIVANPTHAQRVEELTQCLHEQVIKKY